MPLNDERRINGNYRIVIFNYNHTTYVKQEQIAEKAMNDLQEEEE